MDRAALADKGEDPERATMAAMRVPSALLMPLTCFIFACGEAKTPSTSPEHAAAANTKEPVSVRPGINDRYYKDDAVDEWSDILERERREVIALRDPIVAALELTPGLAVADIGAGTGAFVAALSVGVEESGRVYAVDIVPAFLEHLRTRAQAEQLTNLEVVAATPTDVALPDASVDLLFMCDVYHHIEFPSIYLETLYRALRPGGRLVIVEFDRVPGKTSARMLEHVRQDQATLVTEVTAAGFHLAREIDSIPFEENYMLVFER